MIHTLKPGLISDEAKCLSMRGLQDIRPLASVTRHIEGHGLDTQILELGLTRTYRQMVLIAAGGRLLWAEKDTGLLFELDGRCLSSENVRLSTTDRSPQPTLWCVTNNSGVAA